MSVLKQIAVACLAAIAAGVGTALGAVASEQIQQRLNPPEPEKRSRRRRSKR